MGYKDFDIKDTYESGVSDLVEDFFSPVLSESVKYDRIAGFFSSTCLSIVARGMYEFISNGGHMRLITSPKLNKSDATVLERFVDNPESLTVEELGMELESLGDTFFDNHVKALGWMLCNGVLEMKLAIVVNPDGTIANTEEAYETGLFHQKVGILTDENGNQLSFSGSINETATAWTQNDEEFKVFKEWDEHRNYFESDKKKFDEIWSGERKNIRVFDLPSAVKKRIIEYSKNFDIESVSLQKYRRFKNQKRFDFHNYKIPLFSFQGDALNKWKYECNYSQMFEMATGCGKTRTAIAGISYLAERNEKLLVIVSTPQNTLTKQWISEMKKLDVAFAFNCLADSTNSNWKFQLMQYIIDQRIGRCNQIGVFTTHDTASSPAFISLITEQVGEDVKVCFVGDEAHWLGAKELRKALLSRYDYRIGLSATPTRWFDDDGTHYLSNYFGDNHFEFTIKDALHQINPITNKHFLVNYYYYLRKANLTDKECSNYVKITKNLIALSLKKENDSAAAEKYQLLLEKRANILKNAEAKYDVLKSIIKELDSKNELNNLLVFVSPQQIDRVLEILSSNGVVCHRLTQKEGNTPMKKYGGKTERQYIIQRFIDKDYQAIVAIKCLDEGIDIPSACRGILMASSTNPREYVQRIGRIIRQDEGKHFAYLYDIYANCDSEMSEADKSFDQSIRNKEYARIKEIAQNSINPIDTNLLIY